MPIFAEQIAEYHDAARTFRAIDGRSNLVKAIIQIVTSFFEVSDLVALDRAQQYADRIITELNTRSQLLRSRSRHGRASSEVGSAHRSWRFLIGLRFQSFALDQFIETLSNVTMLAMKLCAQSQIELEDRMTEKILIIDGHPDREETRLCHALTKAYHKGCETGGHEVRHIKISEISFPLLRTKAEFECDQLPADIKQAQEAFRWCNHILIVYPLWLGTMPSLLKGFFEQVFRPGFAFDQDAKGWPKGILSGKSARIVVTMGMPSWVYRWVFGAHSLKSLERNILRFAGIKPIWETFYRMVEAASDAKRAHWVSEMQNLGRKAR